MSQITPVTTTANVTINKRSWELPLTILLWVNVVAVIIFVIGFLVLLGSAGEDVSTGYYG